MINLTEKAKLIKVLGYQSMDTGKSSTMVQLDYNQEVVFIIACETLAQTVTVFAYQSTTSTGGSAMAAHYQKAGTGTQNLSELDGAYTTLPTTGATMTTSTDNYKIMVVTIKGSDLTAGYKYVGIVTTATTGSNYASIYAIVDNSRYGQAIPPSVQ